MRRLNAQIHQRYGSKLQTSLPIDRTFTTPLELYMGSTLPSGVHLLQDHCVRVSIPLINLLIYIEVIEGVAGSMSQLPIQNELNVKQQFLRIYA
jgi:hypothetical protein